MPMIENGTLKRLRAGDLALGFGVRLMRSADLGLVARACDYDWVMIDLEHSAIDLDCACQMATAALGTGLAPLVRVPSHFHWHAARALDGGAMGIIVPHVDTAEQARAAVQHCKYPPVGNRSLAGAMPQLAFASIPPREALPAMNKEIMVVVMIETPEAVENADAIAATAGVDVLLIGSNDLSAQMGIPGEFAHDRVAKAYDTVVAACARHGKFAGMGGIYEPAIMERYIRAGARFVLSGGDLGFLMSAAKQRAAELRKLGA